MTTFVESKQIEYFTMKCGECGIHFAMDSVFRKEKKVTGDGWFCPNGHSRVYRETEAQRLQKQLDAKQAALEGARASVQRERDWRRETERSNSALKGVVTRTKNRAAAGLCPCCRRTFSQLARHMKNQHPEYAQSD